MGDHGDPEVRAAGGVVVSDGRIAVVHRPAYDDWSLPKGKLDPGETFEEAALREVAEETGLRCRLITELESIVYPDHRGRTKRVRYWWMSPEDPVAVDEFRFEPNDEVDDLRWLTPEEAGRLLTYEHDRELVARAARVMRGTT